MIAGTQADYESDAGSTKDAPYLALTGELWGIFCKYFWENWPRYNGTALYITKKTPKLVAKILATKFGFVPDCIEGLPAAIFLPDRKTGTIRVFICLPLFHRLRPEDRWISRCLVNVFQKSRGISVEYKLTRGEVCSPWVPMINSISSTMFFPCDNFTKTSEITLKSLEIMVRGRKSQLSVEEIACHCTQEWSVWCVYVCVSITNCTWIYPNVISNKCKRSTDEAIFIIIDVHRYQYCILAHQFKMRELFNWLDMRGGKTRTTRTPAFWDIAPWLPILVIHIRSQVKTRQSQSYKFKQIAKNPNFEILQETLHATHHLQLLDKMSKYEMDPTRTVGSTERTQNAGRTDGRTDGHTDRWTDGQSETNIPPNNFFVRRVW